MPVGLDRAPDAIVKKPYSDLLAIADRAAWAVYRSSASARLYGIDDLKAEAYLGLMILGIDGLATMDGGWVYVAVRFQITERVRHIYGQGGARTKDALVGLSVEALTEAGWDRPTYEDVEQRVLDLVHGRLGVHPAEHTGPYLPLATPMASDTESMPMLSRSETGLERSNLSPVPALVPVAAWCVPDRLGPDLVAVPRA